MKPVEMAEETFQTAQNSVAVDTAWKMIEAAPAAMLPYGYASCAADYSHAMSQRMKFGGFGDIELMALYECAVNLGGVAEKEATDVMERIAAFASRWEKSVTVQQRKDWHVLQGSEISRTETIRLLPKQTSGKFAAHVLVTMAATAEIAPLPTAGDVKRRSDAAKDALSKLFSEEQCRNYTGPSGSGQLQEKEAVQSFNEAFKIFGLS